MIISRVRHSTSDHRHFFVCTYICTRSGCVYIYIYIYLLNTISRGIGYSPISIHGTYKTILKGRSFGYPEAGRDEVEELPD